MPPKPAMVKSVARNRDRSLDDVAGEAGGRLRDGVGGHLRDGLEHGSGAQGRIELNKLVGGDHQRFVVDSESHAQRRISQRDHLLGIVGGQIDQGQRVGGAGRCGVVSKMRHQQPVTIGRKRDGARLRIDVDGRLNIAIRERHHIDAIRGEVGDVQDAARFIEGDVRRLAADRHYRAERRAERHCRRQNRARECQNPRACETYLNSILRKLEITYRKLAGASRGGLFCSRAT